MCVCLCMHASTHACSCKGPSWSDGQILVVFIRSCPPCVLSQSPSLGPGACCLGRAGRPVSPAILLSASPALGLQVCTITLTSFTLMLRMEFRSSYLQDKHLTNWATSPAPYHLSGCLCFSVSALFCAIGLFFKELQSFPLRGYVLGKLSQILFTWKCLCLASFGLWEIFFSACMAAANDYFLLVYQRNFSTVFCFHFVKNVYQSHGHFFVDKYVSVLLKCILFWKIVSTHGHWEDSTANGCSCLPLSPRL